MKTNISTRTNVHENHNAYCNELTVYINQLPPLVRPVCLLKWFNNKKRLDFWHIPRLYLLLVTYDVLYLVNWYKFSISDVSCSWFLLYQFHIKDSRLKTQDSYTLACLTALTG